MKTRIRTVKPELFTHTGLFDAETEFGLPLRLAFIGLFLICDREGRFKWVPREIKTAVLPYDDGVDFGAVLDALHSSGFIHRYSQNGKEYGCIPSWPRHQSINQRESKSEIPAPTDLGEFGTHMHARANTDSDFVYRGQNVAETLRERIFDRDGRRCVRCGSLNNLTVDHIFPRSMGGTHAETNLRTLCKSCNSSRPVQGRALEDDLASDGLTLNDKARICTHMQARVEGKGREGEVGVYDTTHGASSSQSEIETDPEGDDDEFPFGPVQKPDEVKQAVAEFNDRARTNSWPTCQKLTDQRRVKLRARLRDAGGIEGWLMALDRAGRSDFLMGRVDAGRGAFTPDIDFFLQDKSFTKLMEGSYDNRSSASRPGQRQPGSGSPDRRGAGIASIVARREAERASGLQDG